MLNNRQKNIDTFKTGICPYIDGFQIKEESEEELVEELEEKELEKIKDDSKTFIEYTEKKSKGIWFVYDLFKDCFNFLVPSALEKKLYETKNKNKSNELVEEIKNRWSNLEGEIKKMPEDEKETEKPYKILKIVEDVLDFDLKIRK